MTMQSVFGWEIPREEACCYLREIMKSIPNERTGENPSNQVTLKPEIIIFMGFQSFLPHVLSANAAGGFKNPPSLLLILWDED